MKLNKFFLILLASLLIFSCSKDKKVSLINEKTLKDQMVEAFKEGYEELEKGDVLYAAKKFNEAELLYPQSEWAPKSALMAAYAYYSQDYYYDAEYELERFIKLYPNEDSIPYAHYLLGMVQYVQLEL